MYEAGILTAIAVIVLWMKMSTVTIRHLLRFDIIIDIAFTLFLAWLLAGTYSGMMAAIVAGLSLSICLFVMKKTMGYYTYVPRKCQACGVTSKRETFVQPEWVLRKPSFRFWRKRHTH